MNIKAFLLGAAALGLVAGDAQAGDATSGDIAIKAAWARASAGAAANGAAFMSVVNGGAAADAIVAASAPVAKKAELHTHKMDGEVMRMRQVESIPLPAGETVELKPGGLHVMFMGLNEPLKEGASFPLTLTFAKAGEVTVQVDVKGVGAMGAMGSMGGTDHGNMKMKH